MPDANDDLWPRRETYANVKPKEPRKPMARPDYPRTYIDYADVLHIELVNQTTALSLHYSTLANGVRLVYDSVGRLVGIDIAPRE